MMDKQTDYEDVICVQCGKVSKVPAGHLTEAGKRNHRCRVCQESVVERRVEEKRIGNRKLLID